jgi:AraC-like DNA-binding protein
MIRYFQPEGSLKNIVSAILYLEGLGTGLALQRVYQNIIINIGDPFYTSDPYADEAARTTSSGVWINGKHEYPFILENPGKAAFYVVAVKAGMLPCLIDIPVSETNERALPAELWTSHNLHELRESLLVSNSPDANFQLIEAFFTRMLMPSKLPDPGIIEYINRSLETDTVEDMCRRLGYSRKWVWTTVKKAFGSPLKNMQGIIRFNQHLTNIATVPEAPLSGLHGFYDQAHFINDFKRRTGMTPKYYQLLCRRFPDTRNHPNFINIDKETFLQFRREQGF